jgi:hypothetical protein
MRSNPRSLQAEPLLGAELILPAAKGVLLATRDGPARRDRRSFIGPT